MLKLSLQCTHPLNLPPRGCQKCCVLNLTLEREKKKKTATTKLTLKLPLLGFLVATHCKAVATQQQGVQQKCWHSFKAGGVSSPVSRQSVQNTSSVLLTESRQHQGCSPGALWPAGNVDAKSLLCLDKYLLLATSVLLIYSARTGTPQQEGKHFLLFLCHLTVFVHLTNFTLWWVQPKQPVCRNCECLFSHHSHF